MIRALSAALVALGLLTTTAIAQSMPKIFVASTGSDSNDGGRATPKRSFQAAHDAVAAGGEIVALDTAGYGAVTITKSVGIVVPPGVNGFITVTASNANGVTINAGANDVVSLRGLIVEGPGSASAGYGIRVLSVGTLVVEDSVVREFADGILVYSSVSSNVVVQRTSIRHTYLNGLAAADTAANVSLSVAVIDSEVTKGINAFDAESYNSGSHTRIVATRCVVSGMTTSAFHVNGGETVADGCTISANASVFTTTGVGGGVTYSTGKNTIYNNGSLGTAPTMLAAQ